MNIIETIKNGSWKGAFQGLGMKFTEARPELLLVSGIVSVLAGTIYACTKTEKAKEIAEETKTEVQKAEADFAGYFPEGVELMPATVKQLKIEQGKRYVGIYGRMMYQFLKIYGVPALLWFGGMGMIVGGHKDLRVRNQHLAADIFAGTKLLQEYRERVAKAVGEETEQKIFMGAQEGTVNVLEKDEETGEEKIVQKQGDVFYAQPGSIFARNFTAATSDAFDIRSFADYYLDARIDAINKDLELGMARAYSGLDILRKLGFNENALGDDDSVDKLLAYGISGNARKVTDPEMRKLKVTRLRGYEKQWDNVRQIEVYVPCLRLDFNFYPLEGKI